MILAQIAQSSATQTGVGNTLNSALAGSGALIAGAFTLCIADRWMRRRQPHEQAWTIAMGLFTIGSGALWWAESLGWNIFVFRIFFLTGAVLNVAWLALGTIYLLAGLRFGNAVRSWLVWLSGFATGVVLLAPTKKSVVGSEFPTGHDIFGAAPRILAAVGSGIPALVIILGALWSAGRVARKKQPALIHFVQRNVLSTSRLALGNVLIAAGTIVLSASGTLAGRLGQDRAFAVTLLIGVSVLFSGFLVASNSAHHKR
ncbi:MAG: hypothetical protein D4R44_06785 [Actinobacteria bacterium]|nr:MAG: hypothetical protein D4R44_06785 [Actinomycetota bacterium]